MFWKNRKKEIKPEPFVNKVKYTYLDYKMYDNGEIESSRGDSFRTYTYINALEDFQNWVLNKKLNLLNIDDFDFKNDYGITIERNNFITSAEFIYKISDLKILIGTTFGNVRFYNNLTLETREKLLPILENYAIQQKLEKQKHLETLKKEQEDKNKEFNNKILDKINEISLGERK